MELAEQDGFSKGGSSDSTTLPLNPSMVITEMLLRFFNSIQFNILLLNLIVRFTYFHGIILSFSKSRRCEIVKILCPTRLFLVGSLCLHDSHTDSRSLHETFFSIFHKKELMSKTFYFIIVIILVNF